MPEFSIDFLRFSDCSSITTPDHGLLSTVDVIHGTTVNVTCESSYTLIGGTDVITCDSGKWSDVVGKCKRGNLCHNACHLFCFY